MPVTFAIANQKAEEAYRSPCHLFPSSATSLGGGFVIPLTWLPRGNCGSELLGQDVSLQGRRLGTKPRRKVNELLFFLHLWCISDYRKGQRSPRQWLDCIGRGGQTNRFRTGQIGRIVFITANKYPRPIRIFLDGRTISDLAALSSSQTWHPSVYRVGVYQLRCSTT
jgi:hypothetical protein